MAYSNTWDETAPLDTSLANLLGQDIRTFKLDIRQRLAQISGTLANRPPAPEAVFAGLLYFATDTAQTFQWSGSAWVQVTLASSWAGLVGGVYNSTVTGNSATLQVLATVPIPAAPVGHGFRVEAIVFGPSVTSGPFAFVVVNSPSPPTSPSAWLGANNVPLNTLIKISGCLINIDGNRQSMITYPCFNVGANPAINNYTDAFASVASGTTLGTAQNMYLFLGNGAIPPTDSILVESFIVEKI